MKRCLKKQNQHRDRASQKAYRIDTQEYTHENLSLPLSGEMKRGATPMAGDDDPHEPHSRQALVF